MKARTLITTTLTATLAGTLALAAALPATAQTAAAGPAATAPGAPAPMGLARLVEHLATLGYRDVREVERESDKLYEVKALNRQGQAVELRVDARTGEVLKEEVKHRREGHNAGRS